MHVTATELKTNIGKYLALAESEDIIITKNGRDVAVLTNVKSHRISTFRSLRGILKDNTMTLEEARDERLARQ